MQPLEAAFRGASQIGFTIVSLTVSLIAVFIPLLFMTGVVGRLFNEFAVTLSVSVIVSADCLADPDADDVRPVAAPGGGASIRPGSPAGPSTGFNGC